MNRELIAVFKKYNKDTNAQNIILIEKTQDENGDISKNLKFIPDPIFKFWQSIEPVEYYQTSIPIENTMEVKCRYSDLYKKLAEVTDNEVYYQKVLNGELQKGYILDENGKVVKSPELKKKELESGERSKKSTKPDLSLLRHLHNNKDIHYSDVELKDYMIFQYMQKYKNSLKDFVLHKSYFDIEVDTIDLDGFPEPSEAPCPINFISYVDAKSKTLILYVLNMPNNTNQKEFFEKYKGDSNNLWTNKNNQWCKDTLETYFVDEKNPDNSMENFKIYWFNSELNLITKFYERVHEDKADFLGGFNTYFDAKTIETRLTHYGVDPQDIMCPKDFPFKKVYIKEDTRSMDLDDKCDTLDVAGWGHLVDLRYYFLAIRKGQGKRDSTKLGDILLEQLGEGKVDLDDDIKSAAYTNFENFALYSAFDSFRLHQLENKNLDIDLMHQAYKMVYTRHEKVMRKTVSIRNLAFAFFLEKGRILSNNRNNFMDHDSEKFKGAFVADSNKINPVGTYINGKRSRTVFEDNIDQDFTGLYPAIISTFQVGDNTLIGKLIFDDVDLDEYYGEILNTRNILDIGTKIFKFTDFSTVLENLEDLVKTE